MTVTETRCPGCDETLTETDLAGVTAEISYGYGDEPYHTECLDGIRAGD